MNGREQTQYRIATLAAVMGLLTYGVMRYVEGGSYSAWAEPTQVPFYLSMATAGLVWIEHLLLRRFTYMPLVVISSMMTTMTIGAYVSTEWDYFYLSMLGMTGIMCLYGKIRPMIWHQVFSVILNIFILVYLLRDAPDGYLKHMVISFFLYQYASFFLMLLFYRANKRAGAAQSGLHAFSSLLRSTPNLMVIVDDKRRVRYISTPLADFAGMDEKAAIGRPLVDLFKAESLKLMFADILDAEGFYSATREIDMNDEPHYFKIIADKLSDSDEGMFVEITDMTEIVLASIEAEDARKEAEAANKSKSAFLAAMSHEIRTPMNAIIGISEIQLLREDLPGDIGRALRQIHASSHGLLGIINDILDLSKIETGKLEINPIEYDVASLLNDAVQLNIVRIGSKPIVFTLDVQETLPTRMIGDEMRLKQILTNILSNAFKYTEKGRVTLAVSHRASAHGTEMVFKVSDTGQGMKQEDLDRLFDEYSRFNAQANRSTEGTGLGMSITRRLVDMMNGSIAVESEYGKGSTFTVTVLQQPSQDTSVIGREHAERLRNFTYTIDREIQSIHITREAMPYGRVLVVDDVETNLYVARGLLAPYGLTIDTAVSGFEAQDILKGGAAYDIVFMDHMMPKMDGVETTRKLRESGYRGVIVALTANAIAGNDKYFKENGFEDFISKPIDIRQMNVILNQYIRDRHRPEAGGPGAAPDARPAVSPEPMSRPPELKISPPEPIPGSPALKISSPEPIPGSPVVDKQLMNIFRRDAQKVIATLGETAQNGDYRLFATTAHAMKSAALNIGRADISDMAKALEQAGNEQDLAFITAHTPALIDALRVFTAADDTPPDAAPPPEDTAFLRESLAKLGAACEGYDGGTARALLQALGERAWHAETAAALAGLSEMVLCSDFDEAADTARQWHARL